MHTNITCVVQCRDCREVVHCDRKDFLMQSMEKRGFLVQTVEFHEWRESIHYFEVKPFFDVLH